VSVTYEVNLKVQKPVEKDFENWLKGHINDVLAIDGFETATWHRVTQDDTTVSKETHWTVHYVLRDLPALNSYLENHATRLRQPAKDQFGEKFMAERRILTPIGTYSTIKKSGAV
jgi:hypothetical protein